MEILDLQDIRIHVLKYLALISCITQKHIHIYHNTYG